MKTSNEQKIYQEVFAPIVILFAEWVLEQAVKSRKKRLYFLARDGFQSYLAAKKIAEQRQLPVECKYLEGSRYAWRLPEYHLLGNDEAIGRLCTGGIDVTLRKMLRRGGLTQEEIHIVADSLSLKEDLDRKLTYTQTKALEPVLSKSRKLKSFLEHHSVAAYENTIAYFRQEGLFDHLQYAIVDSGWTGSVQQTLSNLLQSADSQKRKLEGYYFGLYELPQGAEPFTYHTFFFAPYRHIKRKACFSNCLFEALISEPRGMTIGYEFREGKLISTRETEKNPNSQRIEKNIIALKSLLALDCRDQINTLRHASLAKKRLTQLMSHPTGAEAECLSTYLFSDDVWSTDQQHVGKELTTSEIREHHVCKRFLLMKGVRKGSLNDSAWIEGSIVRNGKNKAWHLWHVRLYKALIYLRKWVKANRSFRNQLWRIRQYEERI